MSSYSNFLVFMLCTLFAGSAIAQDVASADPKFFISADIGISSHKINPEGFTAQSETDTGTGISFNYMWNDNVAVGVGYQTYGEASIVDFGTFDVDGVGPVSMTWESSASSVNFYGMYSTPFWQSGWGYFAQLGLSQLDYGIDAKFVSQGVAFTDEVISDSAVAVWGGLGVRYQFHNSWDFVMRATWVQASKSLSDEWRDTVSTSKVDMLYANYSAGIRFYF